MEAIVFIVGYEFKDLAMQIMDRIWLIAGIAE